MNNIKNLNAIVQSEFKKNKGIAIEIIYAKTSTIDNPKIRAIYFLNYDEFTERDEDTLSYSKNKSTTSMIFNKYNPYNPTGMQVVLIPVTSDANSVQ